MFLVASREQLSKFLSKAEEILKGKVFDEARTRAVLVILQLAAKDGLERLAVAKEFFARRSTFEEHVRQLERTLESVHPKRQRLFRFVVHFPAHWYPSRCFYMYQPRVNCCHLNALIASVFHPFWGSSEIFC
jgi:hypothetical protein